MDLAHRDQTLFNYIIIFYQLYLYSIFKKYNTIFILSTQKII